MYNIVIKRKWKRRGIFALFLFKFGGFKGHYEKEIWYGSIWI